MATPLPDPPVAPLVPPLELATFEFMGYQLRRPGSLLSWIGLLTLIGLDVWLVIEGRQMEAAAVFAWVCQSLGVKKEQAFTAAAALSAVMHATRAVEAAETTAAETTAHLDKAEAKLDVIKDAVRNIQENPNQPGTAGWMDKHDGPA